MSGYMAVTAAQDREQRRTARLLVLVERLLKELRECLDACEEDHGPHAHV